MLGEVRAQGAGGALRQPTVWTWKFSGELVVDLRVDSDIRAARAALGESQTVEALLRSYMDAFNNRDVDAIIAVADKGVVVYPAGAPRAGREYVGHQGLRNWLRDAEGVGHGSVVQIREVRKLEPDRWAMLGELTIGGASISPFAALIDVSEGLIVRVREYLSGETLLRQIGHLP